MIAAFEILIANNAVRSLVREGKTHQIRNVLAAGRAEGMCTLETWLNHLVANGLISYEDAISRSVARQGAEAARRHKPACGPNLTGAFGRTSDQSPIQVGRTGVENSGTAATDRVFTIDEVMCCDGSFETWRQRAAHGPCRAVPAVNVARP